MKKQLLIGLSFFSALNGMEPAPKAITPQQTKHFDMWEFFSEPNSLDKLGKPILIWDKRRAKKQCDIYALSNLHLLDKSNVRTQDKIILNLECSKGHTSDYLAQNANIVSGYDTNELNIRIAQNIYTSSNIEHTTNQRYIMRENHYDLIVCCSPLTDKEKLQCLCTFLKPHGEMLCLFTTQSNAIPIETKVFLEMFQEIKKYIPAFEQHCLSNCAKEIKKNCPEDEELKNIISESGFEIILYEQDNFNIVIQDKQKFISLHMPLILNLPFMSVIYSKQNKNRLARRFMGKIIKKLKKDESGNWIYPCSKTIVHIRKTESHS